MDLVAEPYEVVNGHLMGIWWIFKEIIGRVVDIHRLKHQICLTEEGGAIKVLHPAAGEKRKHRQEEDRATATNQNNPNHQVCDHQSHGPNGCEIH